MVRSYAPGFIFTTSLPPATVAGAHASIAYQTSYVGDRQLKQVNVREVKRRFAELDIPVVYVISPLLTSCADSLNVVPVPRILFLFSSVTLLSQRLLRTSYSLNTISTSNQSTIRPLLVVKSVFVSLSLLATPSNKWTSLLPPSTRYSRN